jgi:hypothetical protein
MVKTYRNVKNKNTTKNITKNRNKTIKKNQKIKSLKTIKSKRLNKKQNGGTQTIIINTFRDIEIRKARLIYSFELFDEVYQIYAKEYFIKYVNFSSLMNWIVTISYNSPLAYNSYHNLFDMLIENNIIRCENTAACPEASLTSVLTNTGQYKLFKIYFSIGFIMAYYFTNPLLFVSNQYLVDKLGMNKQFFDFISLLNLPNIIKDTVLYTNCNIRKEDKPYCKIKETFDIFIQRNGFNVTENKNITIAIFKFIESYRFFINFFINIDNYFDVNLIPK